MSFCFHLLNCGYVINMLTHVCWILSIMKHWDLLHILKLLLTTVYCMIRLGVLLCYVWDITTVIFSFLRLFLVYVHLTDLHVSDKYKKLASSSWNQLQSQLKLKDLVSISECKMIFSDLDAVTSRCKCFALIASKQFIYIYHFQNNSQPWVPLSALNNCPASRVPSSLCCYHLCLSTTTITS